MERRETQTKREYSSPKPVFLLIFLMRLFNNLLPVKISLFSLINLHYVESGLMLA